MLKSLPGLFLLTAVVLCAPLAARAETRTIVDCTFAGDADNALPATLEKEDQDDLPLKAPTAAICTGEGAKMFVQKKGLDGYEHPVVVFEPGAHPNNPEGASGIKLNWDLRPAALGAGGVYELEFTVIPVALPLNGGGRIKFNFLTPEGRGIQDVQIHLSELPTLSFAGEVFGTPRNKINVGSGQVIPVKVVVDLKKNQWAASVDGQPMVENQLLPKTLTDAHPELLLGGFDFGSEGGLADKVGGSYAIGSVKLTRSDD
jgi:hypothetical protein